MQVTKNIDRLLHDFIMTLFLIKQIWNGEILTCYHVKPP